MSQTSQHFTDTLVNAWNHLMIDFKKHLGLLVTIDLMKENKTKEAREMTGVIISTHTSV